jgi:hypothetical protein
MMLQPKRVSVWSLLAAACVVALGPFAGCGGDQESPPVGKKTYSLQLDLRSFTPHMSQKVEGRVVDQGTGEEVARATATGDVNVTIFFGKVLVEGNTYRIDFYADLDRNETYSPPVGEPPTSWPDHQWRITSTTDYAEGVAGLAKVAGDVRVTMAHNAKWTDIDWPTKEDNTGVTYYTARLSLTGFTPHIGQKIEGRLVNVRTDAEVARASIVGAAQGTLDFGRTLASGNSYRIDFYADFDKDGRYTPPRGTPPTAFPDHQWRIESTTTFATGAAGLANASANVNVAMVHNATWTDIDWPGFEANLPGMFGVVLNLKNFAPHVGQKIEGRVVDIKTGKEVARADVLGAAEVAIDFGKVLTEGQSYRVDFYADFDKNGKYTPPVGVPPTSWPDHQWRIEATTAFAEGAADLAHVAKNVALTMAHNATWTNIEWPN